MLVLAVFLLSITCVSASEIDDTLASEDTNTIGLSVDKDIIEDNLQTSEENDELASTDYDEAIAQTDTEVLGEGSAKYSDLAEEISQPGNINLTHKNYTYDEGETITISEANKVIDGNGAVIDMNGSTIRAFHVNASGVTIKNLTIKNVNYNGNGGAIYFSSSATSGTVSNCNFSNNKATGTDENAFGGAIFLNSKGNVTNCNFTNNTADYGGAVYFSDNGSVTNCNFINNNATEIAGAVFFYSGGEVIYCNFINNNATEHHGAVCLMGIGNVKYCNFTNNKAAGRFSIGGAIFIDSGSVENCNFTDNSALYGGAVSFNVNGNVTNCNFTDNSAHQGGAVIFNKGNILYCNFIGNTASNNGGAVHITWPSNVTNCNFTNNTAYNNGGAVYFNADVSVTNCNFTGNTASNDGGAVFISRTGNVTICNFADNTASNERGAIFSGKGYTIADTCIFKRNSGDNVNTLILSPTLNVDNFTSFYGSNEKLTFDLKTNSSIPVTNGNILISIYFKDNGVWVRNYTCLSGEGWIPNLPVGYYIAVFKTEYAGFQPINRTIIITLPNVKYSINVTSIATNNRTVNITAKTNVPKDILWDGKLLFILPNSEEINASYATNGTWWALYTFNDAGDYNVNASYTGLDGVIINNATISIKYDTSVDVNNKTLDLLIDDTFTIVATTTPEGLNVTFTPDNSSVVSVDENGLVTALKEGTASITVKIGGDSKYTENSTTVAVTVSKIPTEITVNPASLNMFVGDETIIVANLTPADAGNVTFTSDDENIVIVDDQGNVIANGKGQAIITVIFEGDNKYAASENKTITVDVSLNDASVTVDNDTLDLKVDETYAINATKHPDTILLDITYKSSDDSVATVDKKGIVTAVGEGTAIITLSVGDDEIYAKNSTNVSVTVSKIPTEIAVNPASLNMFVGDETVIVANLTPADAGNVTFTSDDENIVIVDDQGNVIANGKGQAIITVIFEGDNKYAASENKTITVDVSLNDASVTVDNDTLDLKVDETYAINATKHPDTILLDITYKSSDDSVATVDKKGIVTAVGEGTAIITLSVGDDEIYAKNSTNVSVTVSKIPTEISADPTSLDLLIGNESQIVATLTPRDAGNVTFTSNDEDVVTVDANGNIIAVGNGNATITLSFEGDEKYAAAENKTISVNVNLKDANISIDAPEIIEGENATVTVTLPEDATGNVSIGNESIPVQNATASAVLTNLPVGNTSIPITYSGDDKYNPAMTTVNITVNKNTLNITAEDLTKYYKDSEKFAVTVTDARGQAVSNKTVEITINGVTYNRTTDENGTAKLNINLNSGEYPVSVAVDDIIVNSTVTVKSTIDAADVIKIFRNDTQYYAKFIDSNTNILANTSVSFNINGIIYNRTTNGNGTAKLNINLDAGDYIITATNTVTGEMKSNTIKVISLIESNDLTKYYRNASQFVVRIHSADGGYLCAGENVTFNINGVFYTRTTNATGHAKLNINLGQGNYTITTYYKDCSKGNNIEVLPILIANDLEMKYMDGSQFKAKLVDDQGKAYAGQSVQFNINGVFYNSVTGSDGVAKLNINLMAGEYIITSSYNGFNTANKITIRG